MPSPSVAPAGLFEAPSTSTNSGYAAPLPVGRFRPNCRTSGKRRLVVSFERMYKDKRAAVMTRHFAYPRNDRQNVASSILPIDGAGKPAIVFGGLRHLRLSAGNLHAPVLRTSHVRLPAPSLCAIVKNK